MSTLQYRPTDGKLLYIESGADVGKLARECCCGVGSDPCDCSPALDYTYTVRLDGFTDNWADYNGDWDIEWQTGCSWYGEYDVLGTPAVDLTITMSWDATNEWWEVLIQLPGGCGIQFTLASTDPCSTRPPGSYTRYYTNPLCPGKSSAATCSVS
jgi:hypothetical protein